LWVNGDMILDHWTGGSGTFTSMPIDLMAGQGYSIGLEYIQTSGPASVHLSWTSASQSMQIVPASALAPSTGSDTCVTGVCCPSGAGQAPVCCPANSQCVMMDSFTGCCPIGEDCGSTPICTTGNG
jgi:hypothetical protein